MPTAGIGIGQARLDMTSGHPEWETSFVCCSRCTQWTLYELRISWHDDLNLYFKLPSFGLGAGIVRGVRYTVFRREILTLAICTSTYMHQKNRRIFLTSWTWCMMHGQICPIESVTQSPTHSRIHIKDVGWFNLSILNSLPNLILRPFKNLQNVWHQCYLSSPSLSQWWLSVPWWKRQSNHHSWRKVSSTSIRWCTTNCTYVLCISLCWTLNTWFAISPLLWYEGAAISY